MPTFTVFTPTYNRRQTLPRVFEALDAQTCKDFEWLIVDDGSTDDTAAFIATLADKANFPIRYLVQPNGGKHVAMNHGIREARGALFLPLDSDDACTPDTIETFLTHWRAIPEADRARYSGISCHCVDEAGQRIGAPLGAPHLDAHTLDIARDPRLQGEKWGFHRTEVLRQTPFPEYPGEKSVPEGLVWDKIGMAYTIRFIDRALRIYHFSADGWMANFATRSARSPNAFADYHAQRLEIALPLRQRAKALASQVRYCLHAGRRIRLSRRAPLGDALLLIPATLVGLALYVGDRRALAAANAQ